MIAFNADEIYQMAEQIERNGAAFYRKAAELPALSGSKDFILTLAKREDEHEKTFQAMRADLKDKDKASVTYDPDNEGALYLKAMADGYVFETNKGPEESLTGNETLEDIIKMSIEKEKDSIIFYLGMKEYIPPRLGQNKLDAIIKEEMNHIAILNKELAEAKG